MFLEIKRSKHQINELFGIYIYKCSNHFETQNITIGINLLKFKWKSILNLIFVAIIKKLVYISSENFHLNNLNYNNFKSSDFIPLTRY